MFNSAYIAIIPCYSKKCVGGGDGAEPAARRLLICFLLIALGVFLFYTTPVGAQPEETGDAQGVYEFSAGDVLDVFVFEEPDLSQTVTVRSDGRISLPLIGDIVAEGRTPEMLGQKITQKLNKFIEVADVTVSLAESREKFYYVLGQVEESGQYSMSQPVTVFQALARAGGFLEWAKKSRIMIVRGKGKSEKITYFNYDAFLDGKDMKQNVLIEPGDTIVVP